MIVALQVGGIKVPPTKVTKTIVRVRVVSFDLCARISGRRVLSLIVCVGDSHGEMCSHQID